jgi:hypothetical protein
MFKQLSAGVVALIVFIFVIGMIIGIAIPRWAHQGSGGVKAYNTAVVLQQVQSLSQLVTVKYVMEKVEVLEDVKWVPGIGENRVLMIAHGIVKAGLDLSKLHDGDLAISGKSVRLRLPPPQITDAYLDEKQTRVVERTTGLIRSFDKDLEQTARQNALDDIRRAARTSGILADANERARAQLTHLFQGLGFETVQFTDH